MYMSVIPIKFINSLDQAHFKEIYQTITSVSPFEIKDQHSIFEIIAEFATGKILKCENTWCCADVLILHEHQCDGEPNRPKPKPRTQTVSYGHGETETHTYYDRPDPKHKIPDHSYNDTKFNQKYYYDPETNITYCSECIKSIKLCGSESESGAARGRFGTVFGTTCGFIFDDKRSYNACSCGYKTKICLNHQLCTKCNRSTCGNYGQPDFCSIQQCGTCSFVGCGDCVVMSGCDMVLDSYPPQYVNPVYKCRNNECADIIETMFDDDKDYIAFKGIYDALKGTTQILEENIMIQIAEYATGKILKCSNIECKEEILQLNAHKETRKGSATFMDSQYPDIVYFYQKGGWKQKDDVFCHICREFVGRCGHSTDGRCRGVYMLNDDTTYNECGCDKKAKLCALHKPCRRCNGVTCGVFDNAADFADYNNVYICGSAQCRKCKYIGCTNCICRKNKQCKNDGCSKEKPKQQNSSLPFGLVSVSYQ